MTSSSRLQVIIPVHSAVRPIRRAVASVLVSESAAAIVVCHNIERAVIESKLEGITDTRLSLIELHDGIPSPAGPLNAGVRAATADYLAFLGSDDEFDPGAIDAWIGELRNQELHIGQLIGDKEGRIFAPAPRCGRFESLDPVKDLLNYRTAPVGALIRRSTLAAPDAPGFTEGLRTGEDIVLGAYLWNTARSITYSRHSGGYRIRESGDDRVTAEQPSLDALFAPLEVLTEQTWLSRLTDRARAALVAKLMRYQVIESCRSFIAQGRFGHSEIVETRRILSRLVCVSERAIDYLPRQISIPVKTILQADLAAAQCVVLEGQGSLFNRLIAEHPLRSLAPESLTRRAIRHFMIPLRLRP